MRRLLFVVLLALASIAQAAVFSNPWGPKPQFVDANGAPMSSGSLVTFLAGSSTPQITYTDSTGGTGNPTTITLNTRGETPNEVWLTGGVSYKFVLKDSAGVTVWTIDNIAGVNDTTITVDEWKAGPTPTFVSATSFTLAGDQTTTFQVGRRVKTTNSGGTVYSTILTSAFGVVTTVTVANDSSTIDSGLSAVMYSVVSSSNTSIAPDMVHRKGAAVTSAATTNIWGIVGDYVHVTGSTGPITSLGTAPNAGAQRVVVFDSTPTITHNATSLILPGAANIVAAAGDRMVVRADTTANMVVVDYIKASGLAPRSTTPTRQVLTTGTAATYTTPTNVTYINIRMVGGGGGGSGSAANGTAGTASTWSGGSLSAGGGSAANLGAGGAGGTSANGDVNLSGGAGNPASASVANASGGSGGTTAFGGAGAAGGGNAGGATVGGPGAANTGGGGGSGGAGGGVAPANAGGGGGGYVEKRIASPAATYTYTVGAGGNAGAGGANIAAGGAGGTGLIIVDEMYD